MKNLPKNVWVLTIGQALMMSASSIVVFVGGIIGAQLAPQDNLATLPTACIILGTALSTIPVAFAMKRFGRKSSFNFIISISIFIALGASYAIHIQSFYLFCFFLILLGFSISNINQFRFAAMESVSFDKIPQAASTVLIGGIAAAFIGPEVAVAGRHLIGSEFTGSFVLLAGLYLLGLIVIQFYQNTTFHSEDNSGDKRPLSQIAKQPVFWVAVLAAMIGYAVMSFIMTATPISMHVMDGHSLTHTKWVIQSHIMAMFLPSLVVAWIIKKLGVLNTMITGIVAFALSIIIGLYGHELVNYWVSLILLGIGWNFLFVGGTTILPQSYTDSERFQVQAMNDFMIFGVQAIAALSAGWVVFQLGWESMLMINIPILAIPLIAIYFYKKAK
ncbi:MAG: MFS transporter [Reichenbachiella sp.]